MEIIDELVKLVQGLEDSGVPYAICGGVAVAIHGRPRLTVDIDLVVPKSNMQQAIEIAEAIGFDLPTGWVSFPDKSLGSGRLFRLTKVDGEEFLTLDLLEIASINNPIWLDQQRLLLHGREANVLSKAALIKMKSDSTRTKDRLDMELLSDETD